MVDHEILLQILKQNFGFCGKSLHWFQNYLGPWSFKVSVDGKYSKAMDLRLSIPQGSCNGPYIFTCYCSLINESVPLSVTLTGFTDDHSIRKSFPAKCCKSEENTINTIESTLATIANWMTSVCLKLNNEKNGNHNVWLQTNAKTCKHISLGFWQQSCTTKQTSQISRWVPKLQSHIWRTHKTKIKSSNVKLHKNQGNNVMYGSAGLLALFYLGLSRGTVSCIYFIYSLYQMHCDTQCSSLGSFIAER